MAKLGLSSPWVQYYHQLEAFFKKDDEVKIVFDEEKNDIKVYVADAAKAEALSKILPQMKTWGSVTLFITVVPANLARNKAAFSIPSATIWETAFRNNKALSYIKVIKDLYCNDLTYIVFAKEVVQYFTDSLGDIHGVRSCLYEQMAEDLFIKHEDVFFNTDTQTSALSISCRTGEIAPVPF